MTRKLDATTPLYAVVGATDLAVEYARTAANEVSTRFAKIELEPQALRDRAKATQKDLETLVADLQTEALSLPAKVETYVNTTVAEVSDVYGDLAARGKDLVTRVRNQQSTKDAKAGAKNTVAKAKTAKTQTTKSAKSTASTAKKSAATTKSAAKKTAGTAKTNAKATTTAAQKTAESATQAATDAAEKVGD